jgi:hypothetical protein
MTFHEFREQFRKSYAAGGDAYHRVQDDRRAHVALIVITVLGAVLFELLAHYTPWSFVSRIAVSIAAVAFAQYLAGQDVKPPALKTWLIFCRKIPITLIELHF